MIYKFKSAASGDVIMLGPHGDAVLHLLGREPQAKGIIEARDIPAALAALRAAIAPADAPGAPGARGAQGAPRHAEDHDSDDQAVSLRRRLWPIIDMLERAAAADVPVVWGV